MRNNFDPSLKFTLSFEGGYVNHPKDPGGHTNRGVTLDTLRRFRPNATVADLKAISDDMVAHIYRVGYWKPMHCDTLAAGVDGAAFDYAVNSGPGAARKSLMNCLGGPAHETVKKLCARRLSIYRTFKHWKTFGKGWTRRITAGEALWVKWALAANVDDHVVKEKLEDESAKAKKTATKQTGGAAGSGGATVAPVGADNLDMVAGWVLGGFVVAAIALAAYLIWRSHVNRARAAAYRKEAATL